MNFRHAPLALCTALVLSLHAQVGGAAYQVTTFSPSSWGASDAALGLDPTAVIEDFEDVNLIAGLQVSVTNSSNGSYGPAGTLPATFDPSTNDCCGSAFVGGNWDGTRVLLNTGNNRSASYASNTAWGDVTFTFAGGARQVGFSLQQMQQAATLTINGTDSFEITSLPNLSFGGGRVGYFRIDAIGAVAPITSLKINGTIFDAWTIDHMAVAAVPEPETYALMLAGIALIAGVVRRRR